MRMEEDEQNLRQLWAATQIFFLQAEPVHPLVLQYKDESYQFSIPTNWTMTQLHEFVEPKSKIAVELISLGAGF
jgi:hypothetical protein